MTLESQYNLPVVAIHTNAFRAVVESVTRTGGMPDARYVFVPMPVMGKSAQQLRGYVEGKDPVSGRPVLQEIIEGLTGEVTPGIRRAIPFDRSTPRLLEPDTEDNLQRLFLDNDWTDKLPIILPTEERVAAMLAATSHKPGEVVGHMRPTNHREAWEYTVEKVAVNAVMAGARPQYFPVILALAASEVSARASTSSSAAAMVVVNGPIRREIGMNWGIGAMGPYNHANATIGRAYGLLSQNLQGGSVPGFTYLGSVGNNYAYNSITFAENEEDSPWEPFHVQHGFKPTDSAVSVFSGLRATTFVLGLREKHWQDHARYMLRGLSGHSNPTLLVDPLTARQFIDRAGFDTKEKLIQWVYENAQMPAGVYWDYQLVQNYLYARAAFGEEPYASMLKAAPDELIHVYRPQDIHVVVVGGDTNGYWRIMDASYHKTVSVDAWR
ncbi:MAG: hypothetical protein HY532_07585 [Chloroflexi bacterium]|nr:hypothetical protein [Chloroflexota bacterium]